MFKAADKIGLTLNNNDLIDAETQVEMALKTVEIVNKGEAYIILKGGISTPVLNREIIKIKTSDTISLVTLFQAGCIGDGRLFFLTDPGVTVDCNFAATASITMGVKVPYIILSGSEPEISKINSVALCCIMADSRG